MSRTAVAVLALGLLGAACAGDTTPRTDGARATPSSSAVPTSDAPTPGSSSAAPPSAAAATTTAGTATAYPDPTPGEVDVWTPTVVATAPHDPDASTQGFVIDNGVLYESTGLYGESSLRAVDPSTGEVVRLAGLDDSFFAEGLELVGDTLVQLTWQEETAFVWDVATFEEVGRFTYPGEGWGLCYDGNRLVLSDGSPVLRFYDPVDFELLGDVEVTLDDEPVFLINELECVDDLVFANVWMTTDIVVIDPAAGQVTAVIDASALDEVDDPIRRAVLNGIAYDDDDGVFLLTGKLWPTVYVVRFVAG